jgi:hypothetical protein
VILGVDGYPDFNALHTGYPREVIDSFVRFPATRII